MREEKKNFYVKYFKQQNLNEWRTNFSWEMK